MHLHVVNEIKIRYNMYDLIAFVIVINYPRTPWPFHSFQFQVSITSLPLGGASLWLKDTSRS